MATTTIGSGRSEQIAELYKSANETTINVAMGDFTGVSGLTTTTYTNFTYYIDDDSNLNYYDSSLAANTQLDEGSYTVASSNETIGSVTDGVFDPNDDITYINLGSASLGLDASSSESNMTVYSTNNNDISTGSGDDCIGATASSVTISSGVGSDSINVNGDSNTVDGGLGADYISANGNNNSLNGGLGDDTIGAGGDSNIVLGGEGADSIIINGGSNNVTGDEGADSIYINSGTGNTISGGAANDYIYVNDSYNSVSGGTGDDSIYLTADNNTVSGDAGADFIYGSSGYSSIMGGDGEDSLSLTGGYNVIDMGADNNYVTLTGSQNSINGASGYGEFYLKGDYNTVSGGTGADYSSVNGNYNSIDGAGGNDSITVTGSYNSVYGGDGSDYIYVSGDDNSITAGDGADTIYISGVDNNLLAGTGNDSIIISGTDTVVIAEGQGDGNDTVTGFKTGWDIGSDDVIELYDAASVNQASLSGAISDGGTTITYGSVNVLLSGATDDVTHVMMANSNNEVYEVSLIKTGAVESVTALGDVYYGSGSGLDFSALNAVDIDMSNNDYFNNDVFFNGTFTSVKGGSLTSRIAGDGTYNQSLVSGGGNTSLYGGDGDSNDTLVGSSLENAKTTFFWFANSGNDLVTNGNWGTGTLSDIVDLGTQHSFDSYYNVGTNIVGTNSNGNSLTIQNADDNTAIAYGDSGNGTIAGYAKIGQSTGSNFTYEEAITDYFGHADVMDTLTIGSDISTSLVIDGRNKTEKDNDVDGYVGGDRTDYSYIDVYDASASTADMTIMGGTFAETIIGSSGENVIQGNGGNDYIDISRSSDATVYFGEGDGNDTITGSDANDKVVIYGTGITSADITGWSDSNGNLTINFSNGQTLTTNDAMGQFILEDEGSVWTYDSSANSFTQTGSTK